METRRLGSSRSVVECGDERLSFTHKSHLEVKPLDWGTTEWFAVNSQG